MGMDEPDVGEAIAALAERWFIELANLRTSRGSGHSRRPAIALTDHLKQAWPMPTLLFGVGVASGASATAISIVRSLSCHGDFLAKCLCLRAPGSRYIEINH